MELSNETLLTNAIIAYQNKQYHEAQEFIELFLMRDPGNLNGWFILGNCLNNLQLYPAAICAFKKILSLQNTPPTPQLYNKLGIMLRKADLLEESKSVYQKAIQMEPKNTDYWCNYGITLQELGLYTEALEAFSISLQHDPSNVTARFGQAIVHLKQGEYQTGFLLFESRSSVFPHSYVNKSKFLEWTGERLDNKVIAVLSEQGYGDTIMFSRFIPLLKPYHPKKIVFITHEPLIQLFSRLEGVGTFYTYPVELAKSDYQLQINIMSLALRMGIETTHSIPPPARLYIPDLARKKLEPHIKPFARRFKIGITWTGRLNNKLNHLRSVPLENFLRLFEVPEIELFSFQKGSEDEEIKKLGLSSMIHNLGQVFDDFSDTGAGVEAMDLMIVVDSGVAHLAGTLGKPTWLLLHHPASWYWLEKRNDSPWYSSIRIYRQKSIRRDWHSVFDEVVRDLAQLVSNSKIPK